MQNTNAKQKSLAKVKKATKIIAYLLVFGGGTLTAIGLAEQVLTSFTFGIVLMVGSLPLFVLAQYAKKKIDQLGI